MLLWHNCGALLSFFGGREGGEWCERMRWGAQELVKVHCEKGEVLSQLCPMVRLWSWQVVVALPDQVGALLLHSRGFPARTCLELDASLSSPVLSVKKERCVRLWLMRWTYWPVVRERPFILPWKLLEGRVVSFNSLLLCKSHPVATSSRVAHNTCGTEAELSF